MIRLILADDHALFRHGLHTAIQQETDMEIVGQAGDGHSAVGLAKELLPDIVLMDVSMPDLNGIEATRMLQKDAPGVKVLAVSMHSARRYVIEMFHAGASGYLLKGDEFDELVGAIRTVAEGKIYVSPAVGNVIAKDLLHTDGERDLTASSSLTQREREVLQLMAEGRTVKEIASRLQLSPTTVTGHRLLVMHKLKIDNVAQLTKYAIQEGLTSAEPEPRTVHEAMSLSGRNEDPGGDAPQTRDSTTGILGMTGDVERLCPECGAAMIDFDRLEEDEAVFTWYRCSREGCSGQWLTQRSVSGDRGLKPTARTKASVTRADTATGGDMRNGLMPIRIVLADDHGLFRHGLLKAIEQVKDMEIVGQAADGHLAVELARELLPDVVLMDIVMPELNGIEATREIQREAPGVRVIGVSMHSTKRYVTEMFRAGASAYVLKDGGFDELTDAIRTVANGKTYVSRAISQVVVEDLVNPRERAEATAFTLLTQREREVLQLLAEGKPIQQIALRLHLSPNTARAHRSHLMKKLEIDNIAQLTKYAIREGLTSPEI